MHTESSCQLAIFVGKKLLVSLAMEGKFSRLPVFLAVSIGMFNQLSGINAILYYSNDIFAFAGFNKGVSLEEMQKRLGIA
jgi:sugar transport protein